MKMKNEQNEAFKRKVEELIRETNNNSLNEKVKLVEKSRYEKDLATVINEFNNCKFSVRLTIR